MTTSSIVVGMDVAKDRLDVAVRPGDETWSTTNDDAGITALVARLRPLGPGLIVCEAAGGFERAAIAALAAAGYPWSLRIHAKCATSPARQASWRRLISSMQAFWRSSPSACGPPP